MPSKFKPPTKAERIVRIKSEFWQELTVELGECETDDHLTNLRERWKARITESGWEFIAKLISAEIRKRNSELKARLLFR